MPLPEPVSPPLTFQNILSEAVRRVPVHNPEWTNLSDSDPGMTLLQLFAFMTESLAYRADRIPERNRQKFLRLLGVDLMPPQAARGFVQFFNPNGPLGVSTLDLDLEVRAGKTPFRTQDGLDVLPLEGGLFYKSRLSGTARDDAQLVYEQLYASFAEPGRQLEFYETLEFTPPVSGTLLPVLDVNETVDGLWLALFARQGDDVARVRNEIAGKVLTLGVMPAVDETSATLLPEGALRENTNHGLVIESPNTGRQDRAAAYHQLPVSADANVLLEPGTLEVTLGDVDTLAYWDDLEPLESGVGAYPPALEDDARSERLITWLRIRLQPAAVNAQTRFRVSWMGINAARVEQRARVRAEGLPTGTGQPDQLAQLANTPVLTETVSIMVNGVPWTRIDDLNAAPGEVQTQGPRLAVSAADAETSPQVFTVDRESGEVRFGDGLHGARLPLGATVLASYDYGGGPEGLVGINSIKTASIRQDLKVSNPVPTWGGDAGETTAQAESRIPVFLKHRDRLVAGEDFEAIARRTPGVDIGRVEVLSLFHPEQPNQSSVGVVTVLVIPELDPRFPATPEPDGLFLRAVCDFMEPRRLITTELHVRGPEYVSIIVSAAVQVQPGRDQGPVRKAVQDRIEQFLSALEGGFNETGWPLLKAVDAGELAAAVARVDGVAQVSELLLGDVNGARTQPLPLSGLQLPRLAGLSVVSNSLTAVSIDELQGRDPAPVDEPFTPVPVVPENC